MIYQRLLSLLVRHGAFANLVLVIFLCLLRVLCVSVVDQPSASFTTETREDTEEAQSGHDQAIPRNNFGRLQGVLHQHCHRK